MTTAHSQGAIVAALDYATPAFAVIGLSGRFPGAADPAALWANLRAGKESITFFSDDELVAAGESAERLRDPAYVKACGRLDDIAGFDAAFFGMSPRDAAVFDPQHRVFLECAWEAFEDAGYVAEQFQGPVGVFAASGASEYLMHNLLPNRQVMESVGAWLVRHTGNDSNFLATRASYELNLNGPSMSLQTACSSSLVAVHVACQSLLNGECDMALAGGATIYPEQNLGYVYREGEILSPDGHCRAFDANSAGTVMASAVGCVVLRRLEDAVRDGDQILAVIRGSAVNNDGSHKVGYLAPSVTGQTRVVTEALAVAGVHPDDVSYVEAHGTGTLIGDPIEITALTQAFRAGTDRKQFCAIGSLKTNIGHTGEASGICGFIKTVLALQHREIPASLHYQTPNPQADLDNSPFFVNTRLREWTVPAGKTRIAGVTALGAGGTNVHVLLEEAPTPAAAAASRSHQLLVLSARTPTALERATDNLAAHLRAHPELNLQDEAFTLLAGRKRFAHRRAVVVEDAADALAALETRDQKRLVTQHKKQDAASSIVFMFPGGGAQYARMGADVYPTEPVYREALDEALSYLEPAVRTDVRTLVLAQPSDIDAASARLETPSRALPALVATEYAVARLLMSWGIAPTAMIGHSAGEYAAACLAGVLTVKDAMTLVALRGRLFETLEPGGMLSVQLPANEASELIGPDLAIAAINGPSLCVLAGSVCAIANAEGVLKARDVECTRVRINVAAHSAMVDPILGEFERLCQQITFNQPQLPFISNVTGTWITDAEATDPAYWVRHLRSTVRFADGIQKLNQNPGSVFCEVGPGRTLSSLVQQQQGAAAAITPTLRHPRQAGSDVAFLLNAVGRLWVAGVSVDAARLLDGAKRRRVALPTYPFERQRYWIDPDPVAARPAASVGLRKSPDMGDWFYASSWARSAPPLVRAVGEQQTWLAFTDESRLAKANVRRLREAGHLVVEVAAAERFAILGADRYSVSPSARSDFDALARDLRARNMLPQRVLHQWALSPRQRGSLLARGRAWDALEAYDSGLSRNYFSLIFFAQAFAADSESLRIFCVSSHAQSVAADAELHPEKAVLLGACKVIPREYPQVDCISIDVARPGTLADEQQLTDRVFRELQGDDAEREVALRGTDRWVRRFDHVRLGAIADRPWLREGGVYLITGGLGGIGLELAAHLASNSRLKLVLLGRTPLPEDEKFAGWLSSHAPDDETSRKIEAIQALRALGTEVMTVAADVTDLKSMRSVMARVRARFGATHGVFHAAGVLKDELIALRPGTTNSAVLDSKIKGTLVLDELLAREPLDVFVLFSSVSSILGLAGQADYTAANAFLDAFAQSRSRRGPGRTVSIDWNAWQDVGMLAPRVQPVAAIGAERLNGRSAQPSHPALQTVVSDAASATVFRTSFRRSSAWMLDEHVVRGGDAVIPGTGFLEIVRAALEHHFRPGAVELRDVVFLAPFAVSQDGERSLNLRLEHGGEGEFSFYAESDAEPLVVGKAGYFDAPLGPRADLEAIRQRCTRRGQLENGHLVQHFMNFGPRWANLRRIDLGQAEALVSLELPAAFASDLETYRLHPALLDLATGAAQALIPGFDPRATFHVPFSYDRVLVRRALPARLFSHVRLRDAGAKDSVVFDATLYDEAGEEIASIEGFTMRKAAAGFVVTAPAPALEIAGAARGNFHPDTATQAAIREGMTPAEGLEALDRVLAVEFSPQVVVCTVPLQPWLDLLAQQGRETPSTPFGESVGAVFSRPTLAATFAAPRNVIETQLATLWSGLLGVQGVGVHDDFFELGGYSLTAVRLFGKIKKTFGVDLSLDTLFRAPTIAACAQLIADELCLDSAVDAEPIVELPGEDNAPRRVSSSVDHTWSPLVGIQVEGSGTPFFCVHGAMGNVLNLRDLAVRLGNDRPFYALQAQGADGKLLPLETIGEMAAQYIAAIREVQPHGPYLLGGYSGGGVIAFEMAQQLRKHGDRAALVALLDTFSPVVPERALSPQQRVAELLSLKYAIHKLKWWRANRRYTRQLHQIESVLAQGKVVPLELRESQLFRAYIGAQKQYQPEVYSGKLTLFRARDIMSYNAHAGNLLGWDGLAEDGVEVHEMSGGHHNFVLDPHVNMLVAELKESLMRADPKHESFRYSTSAPYVPERELATQVA